LIRTISLGFVNAYLLGEKNYILVDTGMDTSYKKILHELDQYQVKPPEIKLIIGTHGHSDHIGSIGSLQKVTGAQTLINSIEYKTMTGELEHGIKPRVRWTKAISSLGVDIGKPDTRNLDVFDIFPEDEYDLNIFGVDGKVVHTPGHTKGSISIVVGDEAIIGDCLMDFGKRGKPRIPFIAYDLKRVRHSLEKLLDMGVKTFYLSHGTSYDHVTIKDAIERYL